MGGGRFDTVTHKAKMVLDFIRPKRNGEEESFAHDWCECSAGWYDFVCMEILVM